MAARNLEKMASIDAQLRLLAPGKVSEDDKLIEYDALLLDRFLDILQDLHGEDVREFVQECYEVAADYDGNRNTEKLEELGNMLTSLDPGDSIVVTKSFSNMLSLANLAEEVQIAYRRRIKKLKKGDFADEASATTESDIEETLKRLLQLNKTPEEVFDALKNQTVDLVLTAHPTQSVRRSLLQKFGRIRDCLTQLYAKDITPDDKQELDEALQREIQAAFRTDEIRRTPPTPQDEMRAGMSYFHETIWKGVPKFLRRVDTALKNIGINERVPYNAPLIQFSSWMGGDRDGNLKWRLSPKSSSLSLPLSPRSSPVVTMRLQSFCESAFQCPRQLSRILTSSNASLSPRPIPLVLLMMSLRSRPLPRRP